MHSDYQWLLVLAAVHKGEVLKLHLVKGFQSDHSNFLGLEKQVFRRSYLTIWSLSIKQDLLNACCSIEETGVKPKKPYCRSKKGTCVRI